MELFYLTTREAGYLLKTGKLSPVELTRAILDRIDQLDGRLHAYITVLHDQAIAEAQAAEAALSRGEYRGPLHGIPIALKDVFDTRGIPTTASSRALANRVPTEDATTVARLRAAGTILLGKLAMHEFALGGPDPTCGFPVARNPWNLQHIPGGSSSGSGAAVAAGLCMASLGTCAGGSIRAPAAYCGIVGLKPTYGLVSRHGVIPASWTLDHCGPMARTVEDAAIMLQAIAGPDPRDPATGKMPASNYAAACTADTKGLRIGVPRHFFFPEDGLVDRETLAKVEIALKALEALGARIEEVCMPSLKYAAASWAVIMLSEAFAYHEREVRRQPATVGDMLAARLRLRGLLTAAGLFTSTDYLQAQRLRHLLRREFADVLQRVNVIVSATMPQLAPRFAAVDAMTTLKLTNFTSPYNMTGLPAISVPCGLSQGGLPIGLQLAGRPFDEFTVLRVAHAYEQHARWFEKRPPVERALEPASP